MPRPRPYASLGTSELVEQLFESAFGKDANRFENLLYEIQGGEDGYMGRGSLNNIRQPLVHAAQKVFEQE